MHAAESSNSFIKSISLPLFVLKAANDEDRFIYLMQKLFFWILLLLRVVGCLIFITFVEKLTSGTDIRSFSKNVLCDIVISRTETKNYNIDLFY